ncbi:MAG: hypothetical protein J2P55_08300 [Rhizobiales bacterium]|nr:hypothetical protein [Hyphomicrobiales bacterium]
MHSSQNLRLYLRLCAALLLAASGFSPVLMPSLASAADNTRGAVEQSGGNTVSQNPSLPQLHLNNTQRERIRQTLLTKHTEVEFRLKTTQAAKNFDPKIGAKLPTGVKPDGLPSELTQQIPGLADYGYAKMKDQILLVDAMTGKIVDIIPETQPQTSGQK